MILDPVRERLLKRLRERDTNMKNASLAIGRNAAYLQQFIVRGTPKTLPEDVREALAAHLGLNPDDLRHRSTPPPGRRYRERLEGREEIELPPGFSAVPEIDVRASAGHGAMNEGLEETRDTWLFPDPVIRHEFRARPTDLRMITLDGDSMEPLLAGGDRILVDTSQRVPVPPGIFVIWDGMGLVAKRIEHVPHSEPPKVVIRSVNPDYQTYERDAEEVNIVGRVVWAAKRL